MKSYQYILISLLYLVSYSCYQEDTIIAEELQNKRVAMYDTNSTNKVIQFISRYYYKYDKFLITDPDSSDYLYNFKEKNRLLQMLPPAQTEEHLWNGLETIKTLLLDAYPEAFIRDHFPCNLLLTDEIIEPMLELEEDYYVGRYFCMIRVQNIHEMDMQEKQYVSYKLHEMIWTYIGMYDDLIKMPAEFYRFGQGYYFQLNWGLWSEEQLYGKGFASNKLEDYDMTLTPSEGEDIGTWIGFLIKTPEDELQRILETYEPMRVKYNYLVKALEEKSIDYHKLKYIGK